MRVVVTGSTGLIGSAVVAALIQSHHDVVRLVRSKGDFDEPQEFWRPNEAEIDPGVFDGAGAVIHLAGENIASGRWTPGRKSAILDSRVIGTRALTEAMANASQPPGVLLCASAVGFYGADRGDDVLTEESGSGEGFLAEVCRLWESATLPAEKSGARVVHLRFGMVLSGKGGALPKMLPIFNAGLGGPLGSGAQWLSWVALEDAAGAILFCLERSEISGPVNVTAPQPVTNREFSETLAEVLDKPCRMRAPAFALKLLMGQMAAETVLASQRVKPVKLLEQEYVYACPELRSALERATASA